MSDSELPQDPAAAVTLVHDELLDLARRMHRRHQAGSLRPSSLVQEAWTRLAKAEGPWEDRRAFLGLAANAMRQVMVDRARRRGAAKRGGGWDRVTLEHVGSGPRAVDLVAVEQALQELEAEDPRAARIVELRCLLGLEHAEIAEVLGVSERTVYREWRTARAWLAVRLAEGEGP